MYLFELYNKEKVKLIRRIDGSAKTIDFKLQYDMVEI